MNLFQFNSPHMFICGMTGTGKTRMFIEQFDKSSLPGIFVNYNQSENHFSSMNQDYDVSDIVNALRHGEKIDYIPVRNKKRAKIEIGYIIQKLFDGGFSVSDQFVFAVDECHLLAVEGEKNTGIEEIATSGRAYGFRGVFITQRPALVSKVLVTQADIHCIFSLSNYERGYFQSKGLDFEGIQGMVRSKNQEVSHRYCVVVNGIVQGVYQERI